MEDPKGYQELKKARAGMPGYDADGEVVMMPIIGDNFEAPKSYFDKLDAQRGDALIASANAANHIRGRKVGSMIMDAIHETDQTQRLMHHMARVQIEATIKGMIENEMLQAKADWLNKAGVKQLAFLKHQLAQEPSHIAIAATLH